MNARRTGRPLWWLEKTGRFSKGSVGGRYLLAGPFTVTAFAA